MKKLYFSILFFAISFSGIGQYIQGLEQLDFLVGKWKTKVYVPNNENASDWIELCESEAVFSRTFKSFFLEETAFFNFCNGNGFNVKTYFRYDEGRHIFQSVSMDDFNGTIDVYHGKLESHQLQLDNLDEMENNPNFKGYRLTYAFSENKEGFQLLVEAFNAETEDWANYAKVLYTRIKTSTK